MTVTPNPNASRGGTSLMGYLDISYAELVEKLGEPHDDGDGYKVDAEWSFDTPDGVATIYNYKSGPNYNGAGSVAAIRDWHIGGNSTAVVQHIGDYLGVEARTSR
jgi:hypothetical protein